MSSPSGASGASDPASSTGAINGYAARREIVAARPDPSDIDAWPDLLLLPGRLLAVTDLLDAEVIVTRRRGQVTDHLEAMLRAVRDAREALIQVNGLSPLESWRLLHPPKYDALDNLYDCGGEDCPATGYGSKEDGALHHRRWAASHSSAASGHSLSTGSCDDSDYDGPAVPRGEQRTADDWARHAE